MLGLKADLEYADGIIASNANGAWLHHIALLNSRPAVIEPYCGAGKVENIFMSGNERTDGGFALPTKSKAHGDHPISPPPSNPKSMSSLSILCHGPRPRTVS